LSMQQVRLLWSGEPHSRYARLCQKAYRIVSHYCTGLPIWIFSCC